MEIISFGIFVLGILFLRKLSWKYITRKMQYSIWFFAACFLILDPFIHIPNERSLDHMLYRIYENKEATLPASDKIEGLQHLNEVKKNALSNVTTKVASHYETNTERYNMPSIINPVSPFKETDTIKGLQKYLPLWLLLKLSITGTMCIVIFIYNLRLWFICRQREIFYKHDNDINLDIYLLEGIESPFLFCNKIYLDPSMTQDKSSLKHMVMHEYCHYQNHDSMWTLIRYYCLAVHWYNPFVWLAAKYVQRDCELACDEVALQILGENEGKAYGKTLIMLLQRQRKNHKSISLATRMNSSKFKMQERIERITMRQKKHPLMTFIVISCLLVLTGFTFTEKKPSTETNSAVSQSSTT